MAGKSDGLKAGAGEGVGAGGALAAGVRAGCPKGRRDPAGFQRGCLFRCPGGGPVNGEFWKERPDQTNGLNGLFETRCLS
jgi:hypothetical protein